jgi:hypothetical protein
MAVADFWWLIPPSRDDRSPKANHQDLPGYCAPTFTLISVGFTPQRSLQLLGFASIGLLTPLRRLYPLAVRQSSALPTASSAFHLTVDTLAVQLTLPLAGCVVE